MPFVAALASLSLLPLLVAGGNVIEVNVGFNGTLTYQPATITAAVGDIVRFHFLTKNHTVTQSSFDAPCTQNGFDSGFEPIGADGQEVDRLLQVNDVSKPIWFYCQQIANNQGHCQQGMVGAINAPATGNTFAAFQAAAAAAPLAGGVPTSTAWPTASTTPPPSSTSSSSSSTSAPTNPPTSGSPQVVSVTVGANGGLTFAPNDLKANVGDIISFSFTAKNHTVTQSSFTSPCSPLSGGFDSGFEPITAGAAPSVFNYTVTDTSKPIWFYCRQVVNGTGHCQSGMVGAINAPATGNTLAAFTAAAAAAPLSGSNTTTKGDGAFGRYSDAQGMFGLAAFVSSVSLAMFML